MIELKYVFIDEDIFYQLFNGLEYKDICDLSKSKILELFDKRVNRNPTYYVPGHTYISNDAYIVLSYVDKNNLGIKVSQLSQKEFTDLYNDAISELRNNILTNDEYYKLWLM